MTNVTSEEGSSQPDHELKRLRRFEAIALLWPVLWATLTLSMLYLTRIGGPLRGVVNSRILLMAVLANLALAISGSIAFALPVARDNQRLATLFTFSVVALIIFIAIVFPACFVAKLIGIRH